MGLPRGAGIQTLQFKDKAQLYASYMPFIKGGAIFFPTIKMPKLGDELFAVVILPDDAERMPLTSKVLCSQINRHLPCNMMANVVYGERSRAIKSWAEGEMRPSTPLKGHVVG